MKSLPPGWQVEHLGKRCELTTKPRIGTLSKAHSIPFLPMEQLPIGKLTISEFVLRPQELISSGTYFEEGDLLLAKITPSFENGKQAIALKVPGGFGIASTEVIPLRPKTDDCHLPFVAYSLLQADVRHFLAGKMEGATGRQRLAKSVLEQLPLLFPPIAEQRAIASILSMLETTLEAQERIVVCLMELKSATTAKLFRQGLRGRTTRGTAIGMLPENWDVLPLSAHCKVHSGGTPSRGNPRYWHGKIPWVKTGEIAYRPISETAESITEEGLANSSAQVFKKGTVLMAMYGQGVTRGRVAKLAIDAATNQACAALITDDSLDADFLYAYCEFAYESIRQLGHGGSQQNLSGEIIKQLPVPVPKDIEEQREIARHLLRLGARIAEAEAKCDSLRVLFSSMLQSLMSGEVRIGGAG